MARLRLRLAASGMTGVLSRAIYGQFAVLSAWADPRALDFWHDDDDRALRELVVASGYGFVRLYGLFAYAGPKEAHKALPLGALLVPAISQQVAGEFARACLQPLYISGTSGQWMLLTTATDEVIVGGDVENTFRTLHSGKGRMHNPQVGPLHQWPAPGRERQCWFHCYQLDHFHPPAGPPLFGIHQQRKDGCGPSPGLCDALVPLA